MFPFVRDNKTIGKLLVIRSVTDDGVVTLSNVDFKSVFALREFEAGDCELLPMSQALKDATGSKQGLFQCTIDNHTYELRKPTDFSPPAWFVRSSKHKKEVNMKVIKKSVILEAFEEDHTSKRKKCILPLLVNTKKLKNGTELVVFEDTCAEKAPSKFGQI